MPKVVDHEERRREIIAALWRVLARDGASGLSMRAVAAEAGVSKTGMAHYFDSQGQLLALAIEQSVATVTERIMRIDLATADLEGAAQALLAMIPDTPRRTRQSEVWLMLLAQARNHPSVSTVLHDLNALVRHAITEILTSLDDRGLISCDIDTEAAILHAIIDGASVLRITDPRLARRAPAPQLVRSQLARLAGKASTA